MNAVQRNFKRQMKQIEHQDKHKWHRERYHDRYTGKNYTRYYDERGTLLKTVERKQPVKAIVSIIASGIVIAAFVILRFFFWDVIQIAIKSIKH